MIFQKRFLLLIFTFAFLSLFCLPLPGQSISITSVKIKYFNGISQDFNTYAEITLNDAVKIKRIGVRRTANKIFLKFPEYISKNNIHYPQIILLNKETNELARKTIFTKKPSKNPNNRGITFRINKFRRLSGYSKLRVIASVILNESVEIECKLFDGDDGPWISWPSEKSAQSGKWQRTVVISDYKLRESIERSLFKRYRDISG